MKTLKLFVLTSLILLGLSSISNAQYSVYLDAPTGGTYSVSTQNIPYQVRIRWIAGFATPITSAEVTLTYVGTGQLGFVTKVGGAGSTQLIQDPITGVFYGEYTETGSLRVDNFPPGVNGVPVDLSFWGIWTAGDGTNYRTTNGAVIRVTLNQ